MCGCQYVYFGCELAKVEMRRVEEAFQKLQNDLSTEDITCRVESLLTKYSAAESTLAEQEVITGLEKEMEALKKSLWKKLLMLLHCHISMGGEDIHTFLIDVTHLKGCWEC